MVKRISGTRIISILSIIGLVGLLLAAVFRLAHAGVDVKAGTITVTSTSDSGPGSLRQTIDDAFNNPGPDVIDFDPTLNGATIVLTSAQLTVSGIVAIDASTLTDSITISGDDAYRVFFISSTAAVTLTNLAIVNGTTLVGAGPCIDYCGGGIYVAMGARLTVEDSLIYDNWSNSAGGIYTFGDLALHNSQVISNYAAFDGGGLRSDGGVVNIDSSSVLSNTAAGNSGGGIFNYFGSVLTITDSTLAYNWALDGGAVSNALGGRLTVDQSTLAYNTAANTGGAIVNGAGVPDYISQVFVSNSTLSGNTAGSTGGGIYNSAAFSGTAVISVVNSTLAGNSAADTGGIYNTADNTGVAQVTPQNTIVASAAGGNCSGVSGSGFNLADDNTCPGFTQGDPALAPLADNGGPTLTHGLYFWSEAIGLGDPTVCQAPPVNGVDQRGEIRLAGVCTSGSFEGQVPGPEAIYLPVVLKG